MFIKKVLDIAETMECPFDYCAVVTACRALGVPVPGSRNFAIAMGHALVGKMIFPETESLYEAWEQHTKNPVQSIEDQPGYIPESRGVGDTVAKMTHAIGLDKLAEAYTKITGKPCGCGKRQEWLNEHFPYKDM